MNCVKSRALRIRETKQHPRYNFPSVARRYRGAHFFRAPGKIIFHVSRDKCERPRTHATVYLQLNHIVARPDLLAARRADFNPRVSATGRQRQLIRAMGSQRRLDDGPRTLKKMSPFKRTRNRARTL